MIPSLGMMIAAVGVAIAVYAIVRMVQVVESEAASSGVKALALISVLVSLICIFVVGIHAKTIWDLGAMETERSLQEDPFNF